MSQAAPAADAHVVPDHPVFIAAPEVQRRVGLSLTTIQRYIANGRFPAPLKLGPRRSAWLEGEIVAWQMEVIAGRPPQPGDYPRQAAANSNQGA